MTGCPMIDEDPGVWKTKSIALGGGRNMKIY